MKEHLCPICERSLVYDDPWYECPRGYVNVGVHQPYKISGKLIQLEGIREKIEEKISQIPSSGAQGMTGETSRNANRGPETDRWRE